MDLSSARSSLKTIQEKLSAYGHALAIISYDGATTAPKGTASNRAHSIGILSEEIYKYSTSPETIEVFNFLDNSKDALSSEERREVELLLKDVREMEKIPMDEYVEFDKLLVEADDVWHTAKETNDFALFEPYLEKIFETTKRFALYVEPDKNPYDYLLGKYEDGLNQETCDNFFNKVRSRLVPLIEKTSSMPEIDDSFITNGEFSKDRQIELSDYLMELIGLDRQHVGISETEHPFTTSLGSHKDVRITTHYHENNFVSSMYSVIHEGGHALYDTGSKDEYAYTALDGGVSMSIHESQSRFYENIIGRSYEFIETIYPKVTELFPQLINYSAADLYRAVNKIMPSLIRTEADETTYCLHVMIRYELEKRIMNGSLKVHDLPSEWNRLYKEYLGVDVPDDKRGVLQDSHWAGGLIGYFPSYALGSAYGVQFLNLMNESFNVYDDVADGIFSRINAWNRENIWEHGCLYKASDLLGRIFKDGFDPDEYLDYLEAKAKRVYDF